MLSQHLPSAAKPSFSASGSSATTVMTELISPITTSSRARHFQNKDSTILGLYNEDGHGAYQPWDHGLRDVTLRAEDEGAFRTPTLRNVAVTAPYMHDGSLATLEVVISATLRRQRP